jgi:5-methylcytosine-specific restriction endonuclease McrA
MHSTLILNASYEPLNIVPARKAINLILSGKAVAVDSSERYFHSATGSIEIPYVVQLNYMVTKEYGKGAAFSRRGVLHRDNHKCVYCGKKATTIDHVHPKSLGGADSYENCVAACTKCNNKKDNKLLETMGWTLDFVPKAPSPYAALINKHCPDLTHREIWTPFVDPWVATKKIAV